MCWSVHRGRVRACARARVCSCAAQALPDEPTHAGNGSPVPELPNYRTSPRARGHPPCRALFTGENIHYHLYHCFISLISVLLFNGEAPCRAYL